MPSDPGMVLVEPEETDQESIDRPIPSVSDSLCSETVPKIKEHSQPSQSGDGLAWWGNVCADCRIWVVGSVRLHLGPCAGILDGYLIGCYASGSLIGSVGCEIQPKDLVKFSLGFYPGGLDGCLVGHHTSGSQTALWIVRYGSWT